MIGYLALVFYVDFHCRMYRLEGGRCVLWWSGSNAHANAGMTRRRERIANQPEQPTKNIFQLRPRLVITACVVYVLMCLCQIAWNKEDFRTSRWRRAWAFADDDNMCFKANGFFSMHLISFGLESVQLRRLEITLCSEKIRIQSQRFWSCSFQVACSSLALPSKQRLGGTTE